MLVSHSLRNLYSNNRAASNNNSIFANSHGSKD
jgi:hypothetical protein